MHREEGKVQEVKKGPEEKPAKSKPPSFKQLYETGCAFLKKKMPDQAISNLEAAIKMKPHNVNANRAIIQCYHLAKKKNPKRAMVYRDKLRTAYQRLENQCHGLIMTFCKIGDFKKAIPIYEEIKRVNPNYISKYEGDFYQAYHQLGEELASQNHFPPAVIYFDKAVELGRRLEGGSNKKVAQTLYNLASVCEKSKRLNESIRFYKQASQMDGSLTDLCHERLVEIYRKQAFIFERQKKPDRTIYSLQNALAIAPKNIKILDQLGTVYHKQKNYSKALECFTRADTLQPEDIRTYIHLASTYRAFGNQDQAAAYQEKIEALKAAQVRATLAQKDTQEKPEPKNDSASQENILPGEPAQ